MNDLMKLIYDENREEYKSPKYGDTVHFIDDENHQFYGPCVFIEEIPFSSSKSPYQHIKINSSKLGIIECHLSDIKLIP